MNNVTNQRGYSWLLKFFNAWSVFFSVCTFMNSISMYFECFDFSFSELHSDCVDIVSSYISIHIPRYVSREEASVAEAWCMPECLYWHWENNDQNVFMGWYSMVYLSYTVCVFCFPRSWWGWLAGVFMKSLCNINMKIQSCWLINLVFFFVVGLYFPLKCIWLCFHCIAMFGAPSFLLGHNQPRGVLLEKTWVEIQLKTFSLRLNQIVCVKKKTHNFKWIFRQPEANFFE